MLMAASSASPVEEIKARIDLVDFIREYVPLKRMGGNWKGLCPFHTEKTPSFMVSSEKGIWKCFGCNAGGDLFAFLMKREGLEFPEALRLLASRSGVVLRSQDPKIANQRSRLLDLIKAAADFFHRELLESPAAETARQYLGATRRLSDETIQTFLLGFAPASWDGLGRAILDRGFSESELLLSGLVVPSQRSSSRPEALPFYDRFRGRVMFPITNPHGSIVGFGARSISESAEEPKYLNTPQTVLYDKGRLLFGLSYAKRSIQEQKKAIILEGYMDVLSSWQSGVTNVVAPCGTALTDEQSRLLLRYCQDFLLCFDSDNAGVAAAERAADVAWELGGRVFSLSPLPHGVKDVDELVRKDAGAWKTHAATPVLFFTQYEQQCAGSVRSGDFHEKQVALDRLLERLRHAPSSVERDYWISYLAQRWGVRESALRERFGKGVSARFVPQAAVAASVGAAAGAVDPRRRVGERILALLFTHRAAVSTRFTEGLRLPWLLPEHQEVYRKLEGSGETAATDEAFSSYVLLGEALYAGLDAVSVTKEASELVLRAKELALREQLEAVAQAMREHEQGTGTSEAGKLFEDFRIITEQLAQL